MKEILSAYRLPILIGLIIVACLGLWFGGKHIYSNIYDKGYAAGQQYEITQNQLAMEKAKQAADDERAKLNEQLSSINKQYQDLLSSRSAQLEKTEKDLQEYKKSSDGSKKSLDSKFIDIYNGSLYLDKQEK